MKNFLFKSYAKINIGLNINGKREDGYHVIDTIMVPLYLHDSLLFQELSSRLDNFITMDDFSLTNIHDNIVTKALVALEKETGFGKKYRVLIHKLIPIQGGFGGGSSNAAATLVGMNERLNLGLSEERLMEIAANIGADVPFFIKSIPCRCKGKGEILTPIEIKNDYYCLIVKPKNGCSTKDVYDKADTMDLKVSDIDETIKALSLGDDDLLANVMCNVLEDPACALVPEIKDIINTIKNNGVNLVSMTGSGSGVFALSKSKKILRKIGKNFEDKCFVELTRIKKA